MKSLAQRYVKLNSAVGVTIIRDSLKASRRGVMRSLKEVKFESSIEEQREFQNRKMAVEGAFQVH